MKKFALLWLLGPALAAQSPPPQHRRTENVILVTLDGMRWQEVFGAAPPPKTGLFITSSSPPQAASAARRRALLPFLWDTVAVRGQLYGNRAYGNTVGVANYQRFSYPGYQEILSGAADPHVHSNRPVENPHPTVLDFLSQQPAYQGAGRGVCFVGGVGAHSTCCERAFCRKCRLASRRWPESDAARIAA